MKYSIKVNECFHQMMEGKEACGNCEYFRHHYLLITEPMFGGPHMSEAHFGHCTEGCRTKNRNIYDSCEKFKRKEREQDGQHIGMAADDGNGDRAGNMVCKVRHRRA